MSQISSNSKFCETYPEDDVDIAISKITTQCEDKHSDQSFYGAAALNTHILRDPEILLQLLEPNVLEKIISNPNEYKLTGGSRTTPVTLHGVLKFGLDKYVLFDPANMREMNPAKYNKIKDETRAKLEDLVKRIKGIPNQDIIAADFELVLEIPKTADNIKKSKSELTRLVEIVSRYNEAQLLSIPGYSNQEMQNQTLRGFGRAVDLIREKNSPNEIKDLDHFCEEFLNNGDIVLDEWVIHLFYDRAHILAGLTIDKLNQGKKFKICKNLYVSFEEILTTLLNKLEQDVGIEHYPSEAYEQVLTRIEKCTRDTEKKFDTEKKIETDTVKDLAYGPKNKTKYDDEIVKVCEYLFIEREDLDVSFNNGVVVVKNKCTGIALDSVDLIEALHLGNIHNAALILTSRDDYDYIYENFKKLIENIYIGPNVKPGIIQKIENKEKELRQENQAKREKNKIAIAIAKAKAKAKAKGCDLSKVASIASSKGCYPSRMKELIDKSTDEGMLLFYASLHGFTDFVEILLNEGVDVNSGDGTCSALQVAVTMGFTNTAKLLIKAGANFINKGGDYQNIIQKLKKAGFDEEKLFSNIPDKLDGHKQEDTAASNQEPEDIDHLNIVNMLAIYHYTSDDYYSDMNKLLREPQECSEWNIIELKKNLALNILCTLGGLDLIRLSVPGYKEELKRSEKKLIKRERIVLQKSLFSVSSDLARDFLGYKFRWIVRGRPINTRWLSQYELEHERVFLQNTEFKVDGPENGLSVYEGRLTQVNSPSYLTLGEILSQDINILDKILTVNNLDELENLLRLGLDPLFRYNNGPNFLSLSCRKGNPEFVKKLLDAIPEGKLSEIFKKDSEEENNSPFDLVLLLDSAENRNKVIKCFLYKKYIKYFNFEHLDRLLSKDMTLSDVDLIFLVGNLSQSQIIQYVKYADSDENRTVLVGKLSQSQIDQLLLQPQIDLLIEHDSVTYNKAFWPLLKATKPNRFSPKRYSMLKKILHQHTKSFGVFFIDKPVKFLRKAVFARDLDSVNKLLELGYDPLGKISKYTILHWACDKGYKEILAKMLENISEDKLSRISDKDTGSEKLSAVGWALESNKFELLECFIDRRYFNHLSPEDKELILGHYDARFGGPNIFINPLAIGSKVSMVEENTEVSMGEEKTDTCTTCSIS